MTRRRLFVKLLPSDLAPPLPTRRSVPDSSFAVRAIRVVTILALPAADQLDFLRSPSPGWPFWACWRGRPLLT